MYKHCAQTLQQTLWYSHSPGVMRGRHRNVISKRERQNKGGGGRREQGGGRSGIIRGKSGGTSDEEPWTKQESQQTAAWHQLVKTVEKLSMSWESSEVFCGRWHKCPATSLKATRLERQKIAVLPTDMIFHLNFSKYGKYRKHFVYVIYALERGVWIRQNCMEIPRKLMKWIDIEHFPSNTGGNRTG